MILGLRPISDRILLIAIMLRLILPALFLVALPSQAFAWGAGVHLEFGSHLLANMQQLPAALQALLRAYPHDFLYGCISADITLGKKFTHYLQHCHSWRMGRKILAAARTDAQRACGYGYLAHLAADTVAHSYYVPFQMVKTFNTILLKHTYWEVRLESSVDPAIWQVARTIARKDFSDNDGLMRSVLSDTIFSFNTNKRIFNSILLLSRLQQWQKMLRSLSSSSKYTLHMEEREKFFTLARQATESVLSGMEESDYWNADPTGERALNAAKMIRKNLNLLWQEDKLSAREARKIIESLEPRFREGITQPDRLLEMLSAI
jgi:hypothetical protein